MLCKNVFGICFFRKDSMKVNMDKIWQYEVYVYIYVYNSIFS